MRRILRMIRITGFALIGVLPSACFDEIDLRLPELIGEEPVIEGRLIKGNAELTVFFSAATSVSATDASDFPEPLPVLKAYLECDGVAFPEYELINGREVRLPVAGFAPRVELTDSSSFRLIVELADGRIFESSADRLFPVPRAEETEIEIVNRRVLNSSNVMVEKTYVQLKLTTPLTTTNSGKALLKWDFDGVFKFMEAPPPDNDIFEPVNTCYISEKLGADQITIFNGRKSSEILLERFPVLEIEVDYRFATGYLISIYQQSLSPEAFEYWEQVYLNSSQTGSLFDPVPGEVKSNIVNRDDPEEEVQGYFYVVNADTVRHLIQAIELDYPRSFCADDVTIPPCQDCTIIPNSSLEKPDFWIE